MAVVSAGACTNPTVVSTLPVQPAAMCLNGCRKSHREQNNSESRCASDRTFLKDIHGNPRFSPATHRNPQCTRRQVHIVAILSEPLGRSSFPGVPRGDPESWAAKSCADQLKVNEFLRSYREPRETNLARERQAFASLTERNRDAFRPSQRSTIEFKMLFPNSTKVPAFIGLLAVDP